MKTRNNPLALGAMLQRVIGVDGMSRFVAVKIS